MFYLVLLFAWGGYVLSKVSVEEEEGGCDKRK